MRPSASSRVRAPNSRISARSSRTSVGVNQPIFASEAEQVAALPRRERARQSADHRRRVADRIAREQQRAPACRSSGPARSTSWSNVRLTADHAADAVQREAQAQRDRAEVLGGDEDDQRVAAAAVGHPRGDQAEGFSVMCSCSESCITPAYSCLASWKRKPPPVTTPCASTDMPMPAGGLKPIPASADPRLPAGSPFDIGSTRTRSPASATVTVKGPSVPVAVTVASNVAAAASLPAPTDRRHRDGPDRSAHRHRDGQPRLPCKRQPGSAGPVQHQRERGPEGLCAEGAPDEAVATAEIDDQDGGVNAHLGHHLELTVKGAVQTHARVGGRHLEPGRAGIAEGKPRRGRRGMGIHPSRARDVGAAGSRAQGARSRVQLSPHGAAQHVPADRQRDLVGDPDRVTALPSDHRHERQPVGRSRCRRGGRDRDREQGDARADGTAVAEDIFSQLRKGDDQLA